MKKHHVGVPRQAINSALEIAKVEPAEIDAIALGGRWLLRAYPVLKEGAAKISRKAYLWEKLSPYLSPPFARVQVEVFSEFREIEETKRALKDSALDDKALIVIEHHLAHAACAA